MSSIRDALEKLDQVVNKLDYSVYRAQDQQREKAHEAAENVIDVDFVAKRLDLAIDKVELLLQEEA